MAESLTGKVAIVTGAGSAIGMGRVMALALLRAGAKVAMLDVNAAALDQTANEAREAHGDENVLAVVADASQWDGAEQAVQRTIDELGGLHILVNHAGVHPRQLLPNADQQLPPFWELPPEVWTRVIDVNSNGPFLMARAAINHLLKQHWGRIIGITTSLDTMLRDLPYGPSKATHEALVAAMAPQLEDTGVTVNALLPGGMTNTNFISRAPGKDFSALIQPEVMGPPVVWLASEASGRINGMRIVAEQWDDTLPADTNLAQAAAPAAWPQLGRNWPTGA